MDVWFILSPAHKQLLLLFMMNYTSHLGSINNLGNLNPVLRERLHVGKQPCEVSFGY